MTISEKYHDEPEFPEDYIGQHVIVREDVPVHDAVVGESAAVRCGVVQLLSDNGNAFYLVSTGFYGRWIDIWDATLIDTYNETSEEVIRLEREREKRWNERFGNLDGNLEEGE